MDWIKTAKEIGFEYVGAINMDALSVMEEVRNMCAADKCKSFNKSWSCPPACGSLEQCKKRIENYSCGVLVQSVYELEDEFDMEGIKVAKKIHDQRFATLSRQVRMIEKNSLLLAAGVCTRCESCTYPDKPCRYPDKMYPSMEGYGLLVSKACEASGMKYYHGPNTISFTSCVLLKGENI